MLDNFVVRCFQLCGSQAEERGDSLEDEAAEEGVPQYGELREQDRFLPIANVARIMKKAIPAQVLTLTPRPRITSSNPGSF